MKANLIYDMRHDDDSWFDKFSREDRGQAVLDVLESARHKMEFEKIREGLERKKSPHRQVVYIDELLSEQQLIEYRGMLTKYNV